MGARNQPALVPFARDYPSVWVSLNHNACEKFAMGNEAGTRVAGSRDARVRCRRLTSNRKALAIEFELSEFRRISSHTRHLVVLNPLSLGMLQ